MLANLSPRSKMLIVGAAIAAVVVIAAVASTASKHTVNDALAPDSLPPGSAPSPTSPPTSSPISAAIHSSVLQALATGNSSAATTQQLRDGLAILDVQAVATATTVNAVPWDTTTARRARTKRSRRKRQGRRLPYLRSSSDTHLEVTWDPSHDSIIMQMWDNTNTAPLFFANHNYGGSSASDPAILAIAGTALGGDGGRFAAFGGNPLHDLAKASGKPGGDGNDDLNHAMINVVRWLLGAGMDNTTSALSPHVVVAHLPGTSSYWFQHRVSTTSWFSTNLPSAVVNGLNQCDNDELEGCLADARLLVISRQMGQVDDDNVVATSTNVTDVVRVVTSFSERGGAILYLQYDGGSNELLQGLFSQVLGISTDVTDNYWRHTGLLNAVKPDATTESSLSAIKRAIDSVFDGATNASGHAVTSQDFDSNIQNGKNTWTSGISTSGFKHKVVDALISLRNTLSSVDAAGLDLFKMRIAPQEIKLAVLMGDKARSIIYYPFNASDRYSFVQAMFGDASVLYRRPYGPAQPDLGTLYCPEELVMKRQPLMKVGARPDWRKDECMTRGWDHRNFSSVVTLYDGVVITQQTLMADTWTTTGLSALPGLPITATREDNNGSAVEVSIYFWYQREATTKSLEKRHDGLSGYNRPQFARSPSILLNPGEATTITTPYGGPIYLNMESKLSNNAANNGAYSVQIRFDGVAKHAALMDMGDNTTIAAFVSQLQTNKLPAVDMRGEGLEVHARRDKILGGLTTYGFGDLISYPNNAVGLRKMVDDYRYRFVETQYTLAGLKAPGKTLDQTLPAEVQQMCDELQWSCLDASLNTRKTVQHSNYDDRAACGDGCSGNPWDADWSINPTGWGEAHELGHNMQIGTLRIKYPSDHNSWSTFSDRSGENSNNIFPYNVLWNYYRVFRGYMGWVDDSHMSGKQSFAALQSAHAQIKASSSSTSKVLLAADCSIIATFSAGDDASTPGARHWKTIYSNDYGGFNGHRMAFYLQIPLLVAKEPTSYAGVSLSSGWSIFTLLHEAARQLGAWGGSGNSTLWELKRDLLGMGLFPRVAGLPYPSGSVADMPGNDFLVIMLSYITARDWRPYFNLRGIVYSDLADQQVQQHTWTGRVANATTSDFPFMALNGDDDNTMIPFGNMTAVAVPIDGKSLWPYDGFNVSSCV